MSDFIICLIKYTTLFACTLYAYTQLLRIKLKVWDLFDIPLFALLSAVLYFVTANVKIFVPLGLLVFATAFLLLRFKKSVYETITVGTISLGISIVLYVLSFIVSAIITVVFNFISTETIRIELSQLIDTVIEVTVIFILFKIKRFQSGINPKSKNPTFEIMLHLSVGAIIAMMLMYIPNATQSMLEISLIISAMFALLIILWWRKHITYTYREAVDLQNVNRMEDTIEEYELNSAEKDMKDVVYAKLIHYLNKALPTVALLIERSAAQTGCPDACAARDMMRSILRETNNTNEKCSLKNIPQTGVKLIDAPIIRLFTAAERKNFNASADISADVESWFTESNLLTDDIHILLSYLIDNAVISALGLPNAKVLVELGATENKEPLIRIYDSGEQFDEDVLEKHGVEQVTTRMGVGGSGIGLFTVFEILGKYGASFTLDEAPQRCGFTKFIEIVFDGRNGVLLRTYRESVVKVCSVRKGVTVELIVPEEETLRDGTNG